MAQRSLPHSRHDTPPPGWESGVWVRIQRRRRTHRLAAGVLALAAGGVGALLARAGLVDARAPVEVRVDLGSPRRVDGSAPLHARWQIRYTGGELRVYRNALGAVLRCPGATECMLTAGGGAVALVADAPGEYRAVVFSRPLAASGATMQEDLAGARARGDPVEISSSLVVY
ncbi:MAG TPA: hypothetical protein VFN91_06470 [Myxococcaceae bacterium]|nr:hypothetical protein [Myxococcaceae bacterium]